MSDIDETKLRQLDLTGLLIFLGLIRLGKAVDVAAELNLTQSTISHGLKRLRQIFEDDLFLRRPHGMEPTAFAIELEPHIQTAVESLSSAIRSKDEFIPADSRHVFKLGAAYDLALLTIVPPLVSRIKELAPNAKVSAGSIPRGETLRKLLNSEIDLAIGYYWEDFQKLRVEPLLTQNYKVIMRRGHALESERISLSSYCSADHIIVSQSLSFKGVVDSTLARLGKERRVPVALSNFMGAIIAIEASDLIATVPERIAMNLAPKFDLSISDPPIAIRSFKVGMVSHERNLRNPKVNWLQEQVKFVCHQDADPSASHSTIEGLRSSKSI